MLWEGLQLRRLVHAPPGANRRCWCVPACPRQRCRPNIPEANPLRKSPLRSPEEPAPEEPALPGSFDPARAYTLSAENISIVRPAVALTPQCNRCHCRQWHLVCFALSCASSDVTANGHRAAHVHIGDRHATPLRVMSPLCASTDLIIVARCAFPPHSGRRLQDAGPIRGGGAREGGRRSPVRAPAQVRPRRQVRKDGGHAVHRREAAALRCAAALSSSPRHLHSRRPQTPALV